MGAEIKRSGVITLTTDFGLKDEYAGVMKGVIYTLFSEAKIVDISHGIEKFNVLHGAMVVNRSYKYFPEGTVHVAVVDPGVGGERREIIVEADGHIFVGPDNGIFSFLLKKSGCKVWRIIREKIPMKNISTTFHGRDIFAPIGAILARGALPEEFGEELEEPHIIPSLFPHVEKDRVKGIIAYFDGFGNAVTTIPESFLKEGVRVIAGERELRIVKCYEEGKEDEPFAIKGSGGFVEISARMKDVRALLEIKTGSEVICLMR